MSNLILKIKRIHADAQIPKYGTEGAGCMDISVVGLPEEGITLSASGAHGTHKSYVFATGLKMEIPEGYILTVFSRSGHGFKYGIVLGNGTGIIDSDYRGELMVKLIALDDGFNKSLVIRNKERIAQIALIKAEKFDVAEVDELSETRRGEGGFGSTGVQ